MLPCRFYLHIAFASISLYAMFPNWEFSLLGGGGIQLLRGELESTTIDHKNNGENITIFSNDLMSNDGS